MTRGKELVEAGQSEAGSHRLSDILACPRRHALNLNPPPNAPVLPPEEFHVRGIIAHVGLSHVYARRMPDGERFATPEEAMHQAALEGNEKQPSPLWEKWLNILLPMPAQYVARYGPEKSWEVIGVEQEMRAKVSDEKTGKSYLYTQRYDLLVRHKVEDKFLVVDHKTCRAINPYKINNTYALSGQIAGYNLLGSAIYKKKFGGVILNCIAEPDDRGIFTFGRPPLEIAPAATSTYKQTILHGERTLDSLRELYGEENPSWPASFGNPCTGPFNPCKWRDFCRLGA